MTTRAIGAGIEDGARRCRWCETDIPVRPGIRAPFYCSDECRAEVKRMRESARRRTLREHGLCPECKRPR